MSTDEYLELYTNSIKGCDSQGYENFEKPQSNTISDGTTLGTKIGKTSRKDIVTEQAADAHVTKSYPVDAVDQQNEYEEIPDATEGYEPLRRPKDDNLDKEPTATQPESHSGCRKPPLFWCILTLVFSIVVVVLVVTLVTGEYPLAQYSLRRCANV